jgi:hypothetical protein
MAAPHMIAPCTCGWSSTAEVRPLRNAEPRWTFLHRGPPKPCWWRAAAGSPCFHRGGPLESVQGGHVVVENRRMAMAYRFKRDVASVQDGVREIAGELIQDAIDRVSAQRKDVNDVVHFARKSCKKVRGLVRLVRPVLANTRRRTRPFVTQAVASRRCGTAAYLSRPTTAFWKSIRTKSIARRLLRSDDA